MDEREKTTGWWQKMFHAGRITETSASGEAAASADWRYSWLLPGDAALATPPAASPEPK